MTLGELTPQGQIRPSKTILAERPISPKSIVDDYFEAKHALLATQDPEIRGILDRIDLDKLLERGEEQTAKKRDEEHRKMVALEMQLAQFASKLK